MGVFKRPDSKYWWLYFEPTKARQASGVLIGETRAQRRASRKLAYAIYFRRMLELARKAGA